MKPLILSIILIQILILLITKIKKYFLQIPHENSKRKLVNSHSQKLTKFNVNNINNMKSMNNNNFILAYGGNKASSPNINSYTST